MTTFLTVVSRVANNLFSAKTSLLLTTFIKVDFPTLVYPTRATRTIFPRFLRCTAICLSMLTSFFLRSAILSRMIRLSVSISVSPGPRIPIPPFCLSRCVHSLVNRGKRYSCWASSTCVFAELVCALCAKMSRIRCVRSKILQSRIFRYFLVVRAIIRHQKWLFLRGVSR